MGQMIDIAAADLNLARNMIINGLSNPVVKNQIYTMELMLISTPEAKYKLGFINGYAELRLKAMNYTIIKYAIIIGIIGYIIFSFLYSSWWLLGIIVNIYFWKINSSKQYTTNIEIFSLRLALETFYLD